MTYKPEKGSRQPVVLYDKDNKAIDVSGIEELSSVKIDTGKIASDLELVKDNQGRLYGQYEETWIPVKVDSEGRPILASDVTVNAEGLVVDLGQIQQGPAGTEPWPVQLSDSEDLAQDVTVQGVKSELEDIKDELVLVKSELVLVKSGIETLKENQTSGDQKVQLFGDIAKENRTRLREIAMATAPLYGGLVKMGSLTYNDEELPRPLRPWSGDQSFPVFRDDATTNTTVSFEGNQISITDALWDVEMLRVGDQITVSGSISNDGTYTLTNRTSTTLTVSETLATEGAGASVSVTAAGDIPGRQGTNLNGYSITDTSSNPTNVLQWHMFYDLINGKPSLILISDRGLVANLSWNHINGSDFVFGKTQTIDGQNYLCRVLTGGAANRLGGSSEIYDGGLLPNEWDRYVMNGVDQDGPFFTGAPEPESADYQSGSQDLDNTARRRKHNQAWHWNASYTWCQETLIDDASGRPYRGSDSARFWYHAAASYAHVSLAWRPALVLEL